MFFKNKKLSKKDKIELCRKKINEAYFGFAFGVLVLIKVFFYFLYGFNLKGYVFGGSILLLYIFCFWEYKKYKKELKILKK